MAQDAEFDTSAEVPERRRSFWWRWIVLPLVLILGVVALALWIQRHKIAANVIDSYLRSHHVRATYEIDHIGGTRQVLSHIVVGDPRHPDLTIEQAVVEIRYRLGIPGIAALKVTRPRLYGTYLHGKLSFGALDPLILQPQQPSQPFELPNYSLDLVDGRALLETDYGPIGFKAEGKGYLRGGFAGELAATAPSLAFGQCKLAGATLFGKVGVDAERPTFDGPLRLHSLDCAAGSPQLADAAFKVGVRLDRDFAGGDGQVVGNAKTTRLAGATVDALGLSGKASLRGGELTASYSVAGDRIVHPQAQLASLSASGSLRAGDGFSWIRLQTDFKGIGLHPGAGFDSALGKAADSGGNTLLGALLRKLHGALMSEANGSSLSGEASWSKTGQETSLVIPEASVIGGSGQPIVSLSRFQFGMNPGGTPRIAGNLATGGRDLPRIIAQIEQGVGGFSARLTMAPYQAQGGELAIPTLAVVSNGGRIGFAGRAIVSGDLPGGQAEGLLLPISGNWSRQSGLAMWRECTELSFKSLRFANLTLQRRGLTACPAKGAPIVSYNAGRLKVAAGMASLDLAGSLGKTPIAIRSGPVGVAYPGTMTARKLLVTLGPRDTATTFAVNDLTAQIGQTVAGHFSGTDVKLFSVPLDILGASGSWDYANGRLGVAGGDFRLADRQTQARFQPLVSHGATLALKDNLVTADAVLREPTTGREITDVAIRHDLASGSGHADLAVPGIVFDNKLQPQPPASECIDSGGKRGTEPPGLSCLALGVVNGVFGTVTGKGRIDWNDKGVTSSGSFSSDSIDFSAVFGPVKGASGTVVFTDLLGLTTAPNQVIKLASVNPGIEVDDGAVSFDLSRGKVLKVNWGKWPFMGGTLTMQPVTLNLGVSEQRAYILDIEGLEAAQFVQRMELENISATGTFDGEIPLIFAPDGNGRIEGGRLQSRGGGNLSYVGALTYKDLSTMANMAFDALRSLDYKQMSVGMDGPLTGEIVTKVRFEGVSQGKGAKQNFLTRRIAKLPFRFVVTVNAPFYKLITSIRSMYDPTMVRSPEELAKQGLLVDTNGNVVPAGSVPASPPAPSKPTPDEATIQRSESENKP